jgi:membrane-associated phospholipid phosphatase
MSCTFPGDFWLIFQFQSTGNWMAPVMTFFTFLGYPQAYMVIVAVIYWSVDRKIGLRLAIFLPVVSSVNSILKQAFHAPRPYWLDPRIKAIRVSNGFGMPSGHAQASVGWIYAGSLLKRGWFWVLAIVIVLLIGISRVYLGVHFPSQVVAGWLAGILVAWILIRFESGFLSWLGGIKFRYQLLLITGIGAFGLLLGGLFVFLLRDWEMPALWITNSLDDLAGKDESIFYSIGLSGVAGNTGAFMGVALGALLLRRNGVFEVNRIWWKRILGSVTGLVVFLILYAAFMAISPGQDKPAIYVIWRFVGFFVISFSAVCLIPLLLIRIRLLELSPNGPGNSRAAYKS